MTSFAKPTVVEAQEHQLPLGIVRLRLELTLPEDAPGTAAAARAHAICQRAMQAALTELHCPQEAQDAN